MPHPDDLTLASTVRSAVDAVEGVEGGAGSNVVAEVAQLRFDGAQAGAGVFGVDVAHVADAEDFPLPLGAAAILAAGDMDAVPVAQGGRKDWENIVTCCVTCNRRKGGRTPSEAGMHLVKYPKRPESVPAIRITIGLRSAPDSWRDFLYWNAELDES